MKPLLQLYKLGDVLITNCNKVYIHSQHLLSIILNAKYSHIKVGSRDRN